MLLLPYSEYRFDDPVAGKAMLLPLFSPLSNDHSARRPDVCCAQLDAGHGQGVDRARLGATGIRYGAGRGHLGRTSEEFEKRLGALLLQAPGALSIDNERHAA